MPDTTHLGDCLTFERAYEWFNEKLFDNALPQSLLTFQRKGHTRGYFATNSFQNRTNGETVHEIALNPDEFHGRTDKEILSTLVHEMTHCWQTTTGTPSRRGYHNKQWGEKMEYVGLTPTNTGNTGGKKTGQHMTHVITDGGRFDTRANELLASGFHLNWQSLTRGSAAKGIRGTRNKIKYTCPTCGLNAWAKPHAHLICGDCMISMSASQQDTLVL